MKLQNSYSDCFGPLYLEMPKAVIAAVALSLAIRLTGCESIERAMLLVAYEWRALHRNGIVAQRPGTWARRLLDAGGSLEGGS